MRTKKELEKRLKKYSGVYFIYEKEYGLIAWQYSTGENVEILFIEVTERRKGYATLLVKLMLKDIKPYNSVFVFRRAKNKTAGSFYRSLGFKERKVRGLYKNEDAVLGIITYRNLCQNLLIK